MDEKQLKDLHEFSSYHRKALEDSTVCGCFYCERTFSPSTIKEWIDGEETAVCPKCGIDSVIGDKQTPIDAEMLKAMYAYWFGR